MHQIRYFLAVARTLNFTRAAEECNVAQPSLTRAIQKLEDELGGLLLHRERQHTHLTELGRLMLPHLERTFAAAQAAKSLARGIRKSLKFARRRQCGGESGMRDTGSDGKPIRSDLDLSELGNA